MDIPEIIRSIDEEIGKLQKVRALLTSATGQGAIELKRGRPKGSSDRSTAKRRKMSAEARARISAAQKKRWAAQKSESAKASKKEK